MKSTDFEKCIDMLRSTDPLTYDDGYQWLQAYLDTHLDQLVQLMLSEKDPDMRSKFVELVGDSQNPKIIGVLEAELKSPHTQVRSWAYSSLCYFDNPDAEKIAAMFKANNPHEEFL